MDIGEITTRVTDLTGNLLVTSEANRPTDESPSGLKAGTWMFNTTAKSLDYYDGSNWRGHKMTTSTSTSTTSTSTSTSTTTS